MENFGSVICIFIYQKKTPPQVSLNEWYEILRARINVSFNYRNTKCLFFEVRNNNISYLGVYDSYNSFSSL